MGQQIFNSIAGLLVFQFGISVGAAALCIWVAKLLGTEGVKFQFKRWEEEHKQALAHDYRQLQESYKQELDDYNKKGQEAFKQELASSYSKQLVTDLRGTFLARIHGDVDLHLGSHDGQCHVM